MPRARISLGERGFAAGLTLEIGVDAKGVIGGVDQGLNVRNGLHDHLLYALPEGDAGQAATLTTPTHIDEGHVVLNVHQSDVSAVDCYGGVDLANDHIVHLAGVLVVPQRIGVFELETRLIRLVDIVQPRAIQIPIAYRIDQDRQSVGRDDFVIRSAEFLGNKAQPVMKIIL